MTKALDGNWLHMIKIQRCRKWALIDALSLTTAQTTNLVCETLD